MEHEFKHNGQAVSLFVDDKHNDDWIEQYGDFCEHEMLKFIEGLEVTGRVAVDVGACFGNFTVHASLFTKCLGVVAFEPVWHNYAILCHNIADNALPNVIPIYGGLSNDKTFMQVVNGKEGRFTQKTLRDFGNVPVNTLDSYGIANVGLLKIDVEGMEAKVLLGSKLTIERDHPHIFVEAWEDAQLQWIEDFLGSMGYENRQRFGIAPMYYFY